MFGFTPQTRKHDQLDNSEMISLLGSSVDNDQLNGDLLKFGALDNGDEFNQEKVGAFVADASIYKTASADKAEPLAKTNTTETQYFDIDSLADDFLDDEYLEDYAAAAPAAVAADAAAASAAIAANAAVVGTSKSASLADGKLEPIAATVEEIATSSEEVIDCKEQVLDNALLTDDSVNNELSFKVEQVSSDDTPPKAVILDEAEALREAKNQKRVSAQVNDILNLDKEKKSKTKFALIGQSLYNVQKDEDNLLSNEKEEFGKIEAEDFITGNVTVVSQTLRTGTDNVVIATSGALDSSYDEEESETKEQIHDVDYDSQSQRCSITLSLPNDNQEQKEPRLLPLLLRDFGVHWITYGLAICVCVLCLLKVYQVQDTRDLTARLNEVVATNADLEKQWLILVASRQKLSEHSEIRAVASESLGMVSPKTENEKVISLHRK